jgi:predicted peptidase
MYSTLRLLFSVAFLAMAILPAFARRPDSGFLDRTVTVAGKTYRYQVFVPADFNKKQKWPVILALHGSGERGDDGVIQTDVGIGHAIRWHAAAFRFVVVMPQCRTGSAWVDAEMQAQALAALDAATKEFNGDRSRTYLTGLSMGGRGTWDIAASAALHRFAALVPICGRLRNTEKSEPGHPGLMDDPKIADPFAETAQRIGKIPVWIFHGAVDDTVDVENSRRMYAALQASGGNVKYTEYPGVGHNSWDKAYAEPELISWLLAQSLKP